LLWTLEIIYACVAVLVICVVWGGAPWIAMHWLNANYLTPETIIEIIIIIGFVIAMRMIEQVYRGAIQGLQCQVWLNIVQGVLATLRWAGAAVLLIWVSTDIKIFFLWQGAVS